jgi:hypothetical protein
MKRKKMTMDEFDALPVKAKEAILGKATKAEIARHRAAGRPTGHGDEKGVYKLYPDGRKVYTKRYHEKETPVKEAVHER